MTAPDGTRGERRTVRVAHTVDVPPEVADEQVADVFADMRVQYPPLPGWWISVPEVTGKPPAPEVRLAACEAHGGEEHTQVSTAGNWLCVIGLRGLDEGWPQMEASLAEARAELARLGERYDAEASDDSDIPTAEDAASLDGLEPVKGSREEHQ